MLVYILKSAACLAILFVFYKLFLEKESIHKFKRFYLLGALVFSLIVPALVFTEYIEVEPPKEVTYTVTQPVQVSDEVINVPPALEADVIDIAPILWGVYFLGLFFFGLKFIRNLFQIFRRIRSNPKFKLNRFTQVLLQEKITPHTFFSYIFLNKTKFESKQIPQEVLLHEETHARQKHSWDVIFVELLQVIFWVNPFIYLAKKAVKLNHEFLADQAVLQKNIDATTYKNTLLSYLSPDSEKKYQPLANAINYSSIKKRFTIMKTHTSKKAVLLRSLLLLPLLSILIYGFSQKDIDYITAPSSNFIIKDFIVEINKDGEIIYDNRPISLSDISFEVEQSYPDLTNGERNTFITAYIFYDENSAHKISEVELEIKRAGLRNVEHVSQQTAAIVNNGKINPSKFHGKTIEESRALQREVYDAHGTIWFDIKNENEIWFGDELIALENLAQVIENNFDPKDGTRELEVRFYSTGILRSEFVEQLNIEARKTEAKKVEVVTEEYIMQEGDYQKNIPITPSTVRLQANKLTFEQETELIYVNINKKGQLLVQDELVAFDELDSFLSKINSHLSKEQKQKNVRSNIFIEFDSPKEVIDEVFKIVSKYSDVSIYPIENELKHSSENHTARSIEIRISKDGNYFVDGIKINRNQLTTTVNTLHQDITPEIRNDIMNIHVSSASEISKKEVRFIFNSLNDYGFYRIVTPNQEIVKGKGNTPFKINDSENGLLQEKDSATPNHIAEYNLLAKKYNAIPIEKRKIPLSDLQVLESVYRKMSAKQKQNAQPFPECLPKNSQDGASRKLMAEYQSLAKKYNTMLAESKSIQIKKQDVDRLEYIYSLMSDKQKADAEPFPDFPEPPVPPKAPRVMKGEASNIPSPSTLSDVAYTEKVIEETIATQDPYDHPNVIYSKPLKSEVETLPTSLDRPRGFKAKKGKVNNEWVVSSGANRDSRINKNELPIPPVAPTIAIHTNTDNYSKKLKTSISKYLNKSKDYEEAIEAYSKKGKGNRQELWDSYNEAMELYVAYYDLARKENNFVQPMPPKAPRVLKGEVSDIPPPPTPPEPQSPLDHVIEMAKKGATFYYEGKKVNSDKAIELLKNNESLNIDSRGHKTKHPEVRISKKPYYH